MNLSKFFQSKPNVLLFRCAPAGVCYAYLQALGKIYYAFRRKEKRIIEENIRDVLRGVPEAVIRRTIRKTYRGIFAHYYEKMFSAFKSVASIRRLVRRCVTVKNVRAITDAMSQGRGVILVTAHWGAVEFIPWVLGFADLPVSVVLECQTGRLKRALTARAKEISAELITTDQPNGVFLSALQCLKRNRLLMTECDEVDRWRRRKSRTIDLFGRRLFFDNTLDILAKRSGAPVVGVFLKRVNRSFYTLVCEPVSTAAPGVSTARGALGLWQKYVRKYPQQWYQWKKWGFMKAVS